MDKAAELSGLEITSTGALGKRTYFQVLVFKRELSSKTDITRIVFFPRSAKTPTTLSWTSDERAEEETAAVPS